MCIFFGIVIILNYVNKFQGFALLLHYFVRNEAYFLCRLMEIVMLSALSLPSENLLK